MQQMTADRKRAARPDVLAHAHSAPAEAEPSALWRTRPACPCGGGCPACASRGMPESQPLDRNTRTVFESALGADFGDVRMHNGPSAAASARDLKARAYTCGNHVFFGAGQFQPHTEEGRNLIGHELVHVLQQRHLALYSTPEIAPADHPLERNAGEVARAGARIEQASEPMLMRNGEDTAVPRFTPRPGLPASSGSLFGSSSRYSLGGNSLGLNLGGHTIEGDTRAVEQLLASQLTVDRFGGPVYLGVSSTVAEIVQLLRAVTPILPDSTLESMVRRAWAGVASRLRQLPALSADPILLPIAAPPTPGPRIDTGAAAPAAQDQTWQPSVGAQMLVNIRGSGASLVTSPQRQLTLGDNAQIVFQDSRDSSSHAYSVSAGGQILTQNLVESRIVQLQIFHQLLLGLSQIPGGFSASMVVQYSVGAQLTLRFGPITIQASVGVQATAQTGQDPQAAPAASIMAGPSSPTAGSGSQPFGNGWSLGVTAPPPLDGRPVGGGMLTFGGTV